jgi:two-component system LytT family response regulator/two-component system response regulator LytT
MSDRATATISAIIVDDEQPEVVFLDVHMPGLDGLGVIRQLREKGAPLPYFVLATAYEQHAVEAFRLEATDYLLKPVDKERVHETIERIRRAFQDRQRGSTPESAPARAHRTKLLVRSANRNFIVDAHDVIYATIDNGLITMVATAVEGLSNYRTIEELQANLDPGTFWRVHRSYLVNINRIKEVIPWFKSSYQLKMDDKKQTEIPVSRVQTKRLRALLKL